MSQQNDSDMSDCNMPNNSDMAPKDNLSMPLQSDSGMHKNIKEKIQKIMYREKKNNSLFNELGLTDEEFEELNKMPPKKEDIMLAPPYCADEFLGEFKKHLDTCDTNESLETMDNFIAHLKKNIPTFSLNPNEHKFNFASKTKIIQNRLEEFIEYSYGIGQDFNNCSSEVNPNYLNCIDY